MSFTFEQMIQLLMSKKPTQSDVEEAEAEATVGGEPTTPISDQDRSVIQGTVDLMWKE